jgi:hypothetical protein
MSVPPGRPKGLTRPLRGAANEVSVGAVSFQGRRSVNCTTSVLPVSNAASQ